MEISTLTSVVAAYDLRRIRAGYSGSAIKVRKGLSTTLDIGFVNNRLNTAALLAFAAGGDVFIDTWYDQSGNGNDLTQSTTAAQPKIVASGVVNTAGYGSGTPAILFVGASSNRLGKTFTLNAPFSMALSVKSVSMSDNYLNFTGGAAIADAATLRKDGGGNQRFTMYGGASWGAAQVIQNPILDTAEVWVSQWRAGSGSNSFRQDGVEKLGGDTTSACQNPGGISLGGRVTPDRYADFHIRSLLVTSSLLSAADLAAIETGLASAWTGADTDFDGGTDSTDGNTAKLIALMYKRARERGEMV